MCLEIFVLSVAAYIHELFTWLVGAVSWAEYEQHVLAQMGRFHCRQETIISSTQWYKDMYTHIHTITGTQVYRVSKVFRETFLLYGVQLYNENVIRMGFCVCMYNMWLSEHFAHFKTWALLKWKLFSFVLVYQSQFSEHRFFHFTAPWNIHLAVPITQSYWLSAFFPTPIYV